MSAGALSKAKEGYYTSLGHKLCDPNQGIKTYWQILKKLINNKETSNIPPLLEDGTFISDIQSKANIFNAYFCQQACAVNNCSILPVPTSRCDRLLDSLRIDRELVLKIIRSLNSKKAHGCDDISISMIKYATSHSPLPCA